MSCAGTACVYAGCLHLNTNTLWLTAVLAEGRSEGTLSFDGSPTDAAQTVLGALQGAMLVARPYADPARFQAAAAYTLASLNGTPRPSQLQPHT